MLHNETLLSERQRDLLVFDITRQVKLAYTQFQFSFERIKLLKELDSVYAKFRQRAELRQQTGETSNLEKYAAQSRYSEIQLQIRQGLIDKNSAQLAMQQLLNTRDDLVPADTVLIKIAPDFMIDTTLSTHPQTKFYNQQVSVANAAFQLEKSRMLPDFNIGTTAYPMRGVSSATGNLGVQVGMNFPLFYGAQKARIRAARTNTLLMETQAQSAKLNLQTQYSTQYNEYLKQKEGLDYYEQVGNKQANEIIRISQISYKLGEIGYIEYIQNLTMAFDTKMKYLESLNNYNQAIIRLNYINTGNN